MRRLRTHITDKCRKQPPAVNVTRHESSACRCVLYTRPAAHQVLERVPWERCWVLPNPSESPTSFLYGSSSQGITHYLAVLHIHCTPVPHPPSDPSNHSSVCFSAAAVSLTPAHTLSYRTHWPSCQLRGTPTEYRLASCTSRAKQCRMQLKTRRPPELPEKGTPSRLCSRDHTGRAVSIKPSLFRLTRQPSCCRASAAAAAAAAAPGPVVSSCSPGPVPCG